MKAFFKFSKLSLSLITTCSLTFFSVTAHADCRGDLKKYRIDNALYTECAKEAVVNKDSELLYLIALWNHYGVREPFFVKPASLEGYKKYIGMAADLGNPDAQSMYILTEGRNAKQDPNVAKYRKALEAQQDDKSKFRVIQIKQMEGNLTNADIDELEKLIVNPQNAEIKFFYAQLLVGFSNPSHFESLTRPIAMFEQLLALDDDIKYMDSIKGQTKWQLFNIYNSQDSAELYSKGEPYLLDLAKNGDVIAMGTYANTFENSRYGSINSPLAFAWYARANDCAVGSMSEDYYTELFRNKIHTFTPKDIVIGTAQALKLLVTTKCSRSHLITRELDEHGKVVGLLTGEEKGLGTDTIGK